MRAVGFNSGMWFGVLGPLEVRADGGRAVPVGGPVRRALLAALLCRAGQVVPAEELIEQLWAVPPRSAAKTLQSHVVRLRDDLGRERGVIVTDRTGYALEVAPGDLDASAFEVALRDGLAALGHGEGAGAVDRLDQALAWWRGVAYQEFGDAPFAVTERMRLTELRALALESRADAALALGQAAVLVGELEQRIGDDPYRERLSRPLQPSCNRCAPPSAPSEAARTNRREPCPLRPSPMPLTDSTF